MFKKVMLNCLLVLSTPVFAETSYNYKKHSHKETNEQVYNKSCNSVFPSLLVGMATGFSSFYLEKYLDVPAFISWPVTWALRSDVGETIKNNMDENDNPHDKMMFDNVSFASAWLTYLYLYGYVKSGCPGITITL